MIDFKKVREIVNEHVRLAVGEIEEQEPRITFAVRDKSSLVREEKEVWRVNISYTPKPTKPPELKWERNGLFKIDAESGQVIEFKEGRYWTM